MLLFFDFHKELAEETLKRNEEREDVLCFLLITCSVRNLCLLSAMYFSEKCGKYILKWISFCCFNKVIGIFLLLTSQSTLLIVGFCFHTPPPHQFTTAHAHIK